MDEVFALLNGGTDVFVLDIEMVRQGRVLEKDIEKMWCIECEAPAHIYHHESGYISFRAIPHKPGCYTQTKEGDQDEKLLVKTKTIYTDTTLYKDLILYGNDRAPAPPKPEPGDDDGGDEKRNDVIEQTEGEDENLVEGNEPLMFDPDQFEKQEIALRYKFNIKKISCIKTLFREIQAVGYSFDMGDGLTAGDLVLDEFALHEVRRTGFSGERIIIAKRCSPEDINYLRHIGLLLPGQHSMDYVFLRDAFSTKVENAIFFKVKCKNALQNSHFKDLVMGSKKDSKKKDSRKYIVIYSFFKREANDYNQVYSADITFRQYGFFNDIRIGGKND